MFEIISSYLMCLKVVFIGPLFGSLLLYYHLYPVLSLYECIAGGIVIGYCFAAWLSYICCAIIGGTSSIAVRFSYTLLSLCVLFYFYKLLKTKKLFTRSNLILLRIQIFSEIWLTILIIITSIFFWRVFYIHTIYKDENGNLWSGGSTWSDLSFHLNVINSYIFGQYVTYTIKKNQIFSLWSKPHSVIFSGSGMSYPFIPDWHSASLVVSGGLSLRWSILLPSFFISISFVILLFSFIRRFLSFSKSSTFHTQIRQFNGTSFLSVCIFLTLSGIGGYTILRDRSWDWDSAINHDSTQFTSNNKEIYWFHPVCHILLPQRSALFAYPIVILVSSCIFQAVNSSYIQYNQKRHLFLISGIITGLLPLIHAHSLLCLAIIFIPYALLHPIRSFSLNKETGLFIRWLEFGIPILLESIVQIPVYLDRLVSDSGSQSSFLQYNPIFTHGAWKIYSNETMYTNILNFSLLWLRAIGLFLPLAIIGCIFLNRQQLKLYVCFWLIFIISNYIQFQPWDKDNTKLFVIWVFNAVAVVCLVIKKLWQVPSILVKIIAIFIVISLMLSGSMMLYRESTLWWQFMDPEDQEFGGWIAANTDGDDIFIVNDSHIHPATNLAGKTALVNMAGWVQSHGYPNMWGRYQDLREMLAHPRDKYYLFEQYKISYIAQDWRLKHDNAIDETFFSYSNDVEIVFISNKYTIYDVRKISKIIE